MEPMFVIRPFSRGEISKGSFSVSITGKTLFHKDAELDEGLKVLSAFGRKYASILDIKKSLINASANPDRLFDFMKKDLRLFQQTTTKILLDHLCVMSDSQDLRTVIAGELKTYFGAKITTCSTDDPPPQNADLVIMILTKYSPILVRRLYESPGPTTRLYAISHIFERSLIIDNLHDRRKTMPCHFCGNLNHLSRRSVKQVDRDFAITDVIDKLEAIDDDWAISFGVSKIEEGMIAFHVSKTIANFIDLSTPPLFHDELSRSKVVNLDTGTISLERSSYHSLCGCWNE